MPSRPSCHRPPSLPAHIPFDGGLSDPRQVRQSRIQFAIVAVLASFGGLYLFTENVIYLYVVGVSVGLLVLGTLAWTALMCMILCRDDEKDGDEESRVRGKEGGKGVRGKEDEEKKDVGKMEMKVDGLQEDLERALARKGSEL